MYNRKKYPAPPENPGEALAAAYKTALYILSYRDNTERMLRDKLRLRHYNENTVEDVIARLKEENLLDDMRGAVAYADELATVRKFGPARIKAELYNRGYTSETVGSLDLSGYDFTENCKIRLRHLGGVKDIKTVNALRRCGFDSSTIKKAFEESEENDK